MNKNQQTIFLRWIHKQAHASWHAILIESLQTMDPTYLQSLISDSDWLPGKDNIFNAFSLSLEQTNYILFGESPYPRKESANGYAFWDARVKNIWSEQGLSKEVNKATSLRNFIKMLLVSDGHLNQKDFSKQAIAEIDKHSYIQTLDELFMNLLDRGFLLLNASLILSNDAVSKHVKAWQPFIIHILTYLSKEKPSIKLILFGRLATLITNFRISSNFQQLMAEHPYNHSFIENKDIIGFFSPLSLLAPMKYH